MRHAHHPENKTHSHRSSRWPVSLHDSLRDSLRVLRGVSSRGVSSRVAAGVRCASVEGAFGLAAAARPVDATLNRGEEVAGDILTPEANSVSNSVRHWRGADAFVDDDGVELSIHEAIALPVAFSEEAR